MVSFFSVGMLLLGTSIAATVPLRPEVSFNIDAAARQPSSNFSVAGLITGLLGEKDSYWGGNKTSKVTCDVGGEGACSLMRIAEGMAYLKNKVQWATAKPHFCQRVSCSWNAGIFLCNDLPVELVVPGARVAEITADIIVGCVLNENDIVGMAEAEEGFRVSVRWSKC